MQAYLSLLFLVVVMTFAGSAAFSSDRDNADNRKAASISAQPTKSSTAGDPNNLNSSKILSHKRSGPDPNIIAIFVAAFMVMIQLWRQHESGLTLQRESFRKKTNLAIYENISDIVGTAASAVSTAGINTLILNTRLDYDQDTKNYFEIEGFNIQNSKAGNLVADVMLILEKYEIALPGFKIFRFALNVQSAKQRKAFPEVFQKMVEFMRLDEAYNNKIYLSVSEEQKEEFKQLLTRYYDVGATMGSYLSDIQVDAQNLLLSDIFEGKVPRRSPTDPNHLVISCDPNKEGEIIEFLRGESPDQEHFNMLLREYRAQG